MTNSTLSLADAPRVAGASSGESPLVRSARAIAELGSDQAEIDLLADDRLIDALQLLREHNRRLQSYELWLSTAITRRSDPALGLEGLARRNGVPTPTLLIQSVTGSTTTEARRLADLGRLAATPTPPTPEGLPPALSLATVITGAVTAGRVSISTADAVRRGLGEPDAVISDDQLREAAVAILAHADTAPPETALRLARQARERLDLAAVERGQKARSDQRYVRQFRRDGMSGGSWLLPDEDGGLEIYTALSLLLAGSSGGPRFAEAPDELAPVVDARTREQKLADGFAQIFHNGIAADPAVVPGAQRAAVRVIVTADDLARREGSALLEESLGTVTFAKLEEYLCEGGAVGVLFDEHGDVIDVGRDQRLFTSRQRTALGVRDGGCRFPGCTRPPSWCEAHHVNYWGRDKGRTDLSNGILLCRYHHMLVHNNGWGITKFGNSFLLHPPPGNAGYGTPLEMPPRNPIVANLLAASR